MEVNINQRGGPPPHRHPPFNRPMSGILTFNPFKSVKNRNRGKSVRTWATQLKTGAIWDKFLRLLVISVILCVFLMEESPIGNIYVRAQFKDQGFVDQTSQDSSATCTGIARYGYSDATTNEWSPYKRIDGDYQCTTAYFGNDPSPGNIKKCQCKSDTSNTFESYAREIGTLDDQFNLWDENEDQRVDVLISDYQGTVYYAGTTTGSGQWTASPSFATTGYDNQVKPFIRASGLYSWMLMIDHYRFSKVLDLKLRDKTSYPFEQTTTDDKVTRQTKIDDEADDLLGPSLFGIIKFNPNYYGETYANARVKLFFCENRRAGENKHFTIEREFAYFQPWHSLFVRVHETKQDYVFLLNLAQTTSDPKWTFSLTSIRPKLPYSFAASTDYYVKKYDRANQPSMNVKAFTLAMHYDKVVVGGSYKQDQKNVAYLALYNWNDSSQADSSQLKKEKVLKNFPGNPNIAVVHLLSHPTTNSSWNDNDNHNDYEFIGLIKEVDDNFNLESGDTFYYIKFRYDFDDTAITCGSSSRRRLTENDGTYGEDFNENSQATCSSGFVRFGVASTNTWSADISVGIAEFTCGAAYLGITDPAPGLVKECQCKVEDSSSEVPNDDDSEETNDNDTGDAASGEDADETVTNTKTKTVYVRKIVLGLWGTQKYLLPLGLKYNRYGEDVLKIVMTFSVHDSNGYDNSFNYEKGFSNENIISLSYGVQSALYSQSCDNPYENLFSPDLYVFDNSIIGCNGQEVFISPATIECESQNRCKDKLFYIASGKTKKGDTCQSSDKRMVHADLIGTSLEYNDFFGSASNAALADADYTEQDITLAQAETAESTLLYEADCDFVAMTIPNLFANFAQSSYIDASSASTTMVEWFFPNFAGKNCHLVGSTLTYTAPTTAPFNAALTAYIDPIESETALTTLLADYSNITGSTDYSRITNYHKLSFSKDDAGWASLPGPDILITRFWATGSSYIDNSPPYVAGGNGPYDNSDSQSGTCTTTSSNNWYSLWHAYFAAGTKVKAIMVYAPATLDTSGTYQYTGLQVKITNNINGIIGNPDVFDCGYFELKAGEWSTVNCDEGGQGYFTGQRVVIYYKKDAQTEQQQLNFCGVKLLSYDQKLQQLYGAKITVSYMSKAEDIVPTKASLDIPMLIIDKCSTAVSASVIATASRDFVFSQQQGQTTNLDLNSIFEISDPCGKSQGEKFLDVYRDSACSNKDPSLTVNDANQFQVSLNDLLGGTAYSQNFYFNFGLDTNSATCMEASPVSLKILPCTFQQTSAVYDTDLVFQVIKDQAYTNWYQLQNQEGNLKTMFTTANTDLAVQNRYSEWYWQGGNFTDQNNQCGWDCWTFSTINRDGAATDISSDLHADESKQNLNFLKEYQTGVRTYSIIASLGTNQVQLTLHLAIVAQEEALSQTKNYDIHSPNSFTIPKADYMVKLGLCDPKYVIFQATGLEKKVNTVKKQFAFTGFTNEMIFSLDKTMSTTQNPTMTLSSSDNLAICRGAFTLAQQMESFGNAPVEVINFYDLACTANSQVVSLTANFGCGSQVYSIPETATLKYYMAYDSTLPDTDKITIELVQDYLKFTSNSLCCNRIQKLFLYTDSSMTDQFEYKTVAPHTEVASAGYPQQTFYQKNVVMSKNHEHNVKLYLKIQKTAPEGIDYFQTFDQTKTFEIISCKSTVPKTNLASPQYVADSNAVKYSEKVYKLGQEKNCGIFFTFSNIKATIITDTSQTGNYKECLDVTTDKSFWVYDSNASTWSVATANNSPDWAAKNYYVDQDKICIKDQTQPHSYDFNVQFKTKGSKEIYFNIKVTGTQKNPNAQYSLSLTNETRIELFENAVMTQTKNSTVDVSSYYTYSEDQVVITDISLQYLTYSIVEKKDGNYQTQSASQDVQIEISNLGTLSYKVSKVESTKKFAVKVHEEMSGTSIYIKIDLLVCGNEKISSSTGSPTAINIVLDEGDDTQYLTSLGILSSFSSTEERCWKKDISLRQGPLKLPYIGKEVAYDKAKDQLYVVKSASTTGLLTLYVTSTSYSGVEGYFEIQLNMFKNFNNPPKFASDLSGISIQVKEADQLSGDLVSTIFLSPEAQDVEGHNILMAFSVPKEAAGFIKVTQKEKIFEMVINNQVISESGSYTVTVVLTDDNVRQSSNSTYEQKVSVNYVKKVANPFTGVNTKVVVTSSDDTDSDKDTLPASNSLEDTGKVNDTALSVSNSTDSKSFSIATSWDKFEGDDSFASSESSVDLKGYDPREEIKKQERRQKENVASVIKDSGLDEETTQAIFKIVDGSFKKNHKSKEMQDFLQSMDYNAEVEALNITDVPTEEIEQAMENFKDLMSTEDENQDLSPLEVVKRKLSYKSQTKAVGRTFPDVDVEQIKKLKKNLEKNEKPPEKPQMKVKPMSPTGKLAIQFNQDMLVPKDPSKVNYGAIFEFKITSAVDGSVTTVKSKDPAKKKRNLRIPGQRYLFDPSFDDQEEDDEQGLTFSWKLDGHDPRELGMVIKFDQPDQISNSNYGNDIMDIEVKDPAIFKSAVSGKSMSKDSFKKGEPSLGTSLPPQVADEKIVDDIQGNVDAANSVGNLIGGSNMAVGMIIGGSLQQLWSLIRSLQMLVLTSLCNIVYPAIANIFYQNAIQIAQLDVFQGEEISRSIFDFKATEALNAKFEQFQIDTKNFTINSGSFFLIGLLLIVEVILKRLGLAICVQFPRYELARELGMKCQVQLGQALRDLLLRLCLESYFDIVLCSFLGAFAFIQAESFEDFADFWQSPSNIWNSAVTVLGCIAVIWFPCWSYIVIKDNFDRLGDKEVHDQYGLLFEEQKTGDYPSAQYQVFFMIRRFIIVTVLIVWRDYAVWQIFAFMILSVMNIAYLIKHKPFRDNLTNWVELFNEACVYLSLLCTTTLTNAAVNIDFRNNNGWALIVIAALNVVGNIAVVFFVTSVETYNGWMDKRLGKHLQEVLEKKLKNREMFAKLMPGQFDDLEEIRIEFKAQKYCERWVKQRRWLSKNRIKFKDYPEELKFQAYLKEYKFFKRALALNLMFAHNQVREELVSKRMNDQYQRQKKALIKKAAKKGKVKSKTKNVNVRNASSSIVEQAKNMERTNLEMIEEESGTQNSDRFTIIKDKKVKIVDEKFMAKGMLELEEIDKDRTLRENQIEMVKCMDKMQFKIDPERLDALQELYDDRMSDKLSLDERVQLRNAIIDERQDYDTSWFDVNNGDVIRGKTDYEDEIDINNFKMMDLSAFHLESHPTIGQNVTQVYAQLEENKKIRHAEIKVEKKIIKQEKKIYESFQRKFRRFRSFGENNCLGACLQIVFHFDSLAKYFKEWELEDSDKVSRSMRNLFDQFWAETDEIEHQHSMDETLPKQLMDEYLAMKEPMQFFEYLVSNLRTEDDQESSTNKFFGNIKTDEKVKEFTESPINQLFMLVFAETYQCRAKHTETLRLQAQSFLWVPMGKDVKQTVMKSLDEKFGDQRLDKFCLSCGIINNGFTQANVLHFPVYLAIKIERDQPDESVLLKMDLGSWRPTAQRQNGSITYGLIALIILEDSQFKSIIKINSKWYLFDGTATPVEFSDEEEVVQKYTPYMLFYHRD